MLGIKTLLLVDIIPFRSTNHLTLTSQSSNPWTPTTWSPSSTNHLSTLQTLSNQNCHPTRNWFLTRRWAMLQVQMMEPRAKMTPEAFLEICSEEDRWWPQTMKEEALIRKRTKWWIDWYIQRNCYHPRKVSKTWNCELVQTLGAEARVRIAEQAWARKR